MAYSRLIVYSNHVTSKKRMIYKSFLYSYALTKSLMIASKTNKYKPKIMAKTIIISFGMFIISLCFVIRKRNI